MDTTAVLGEEKADKCLATARGQLKRDIRRAGWQPLIVAQQVGLVCPQVTDDNPPRAELPLDGLKAGDPKPRRLPALVGLTMSGVTTRLAP